MKHKPPLPVSKLMVLCRQIYHDDRKLDCILVNPFYKIFLGAFPAPIDLAVYAHLTNLQGYYYLCVQLRNLEGDVLSQWKIDQPANVLDPLQVLELKLNHLVLKVPAAGKYDIVLLANDEEVAAQMLTVFAAKPQV